MDLSTISPWLQGRVGEAVTANLFEVGVLAFAVIATAIANLVISWRLGRLQRGVEGVLLADVDLLHLSIKSALSALTMAACVCALITGQVGMASAVASAEAVFTVYTAGHFLRVGFDAQR